MGQIVHGEDVVIDKKSDQNIYAAGGRVSVYAPARRDVVIIGGTVTVSDSISGDVLVAGGNFVLKGYAGDDVRCGGGKVLISGNVAGDLLVTGGNVTVDRDAVLCGTVIVSLVAAHWINNTVYESSWRSAKTIGIALAIFVFAKLASLTPFVGPLIMLLVTCMSLGAILQTIRWKRTESRALA